MGQVRKAVPLHGDEAALLWPLGTTGCIAGWNAGAAATLIYRFGHVSSLDRRRMATN